MIPTAVDDIEAFLSAHEQKELLRFVAVGSVDDGKSTLIGRLLHDAHAVHDDHLRAVQRASLTRGATRGEGSRGEIDLSLLTDGLAAEREQGITIDVAYRYFNTSKRKFIIADTPGHVQYTRNMATGASTADLAVILVDARLGVLAQSRRHAFIASLLGIPQLLVGVNKMDLVGFDHTVFCRVRDEMAALAKQLGFRATTVIPISALRGDNVVERSQKTPWWDGPTVLSHLESVPIPESARADEPLRLPVQYVNRPDLHHRGFSGQLAAGTLRPGDAIVALPSGRRTRVRSIDTLDGPLDEAFAPMSVSIRLEDEIDVSRGDMFVSPDDLPVVAHELVADLVWLSERPWTRGRTHQLKHSTKLVRADISAIEHVVDLETLATAPRDTLGLNDIARVRVRTHQPILVDPYQENRSTGAFVLIDPLTGDTVAAGMIRQAAEGSRLRGPVTDDERRARYGHRGALVTARRDELVALERALFDAGIVAVIVDDAAARGVVGAGLVALVAGERLELDGEPITLEQLESALR